MKSVKKAPPEPSIMFTRSDLMVMQQILKTCSILPNLQHSAIDLYDRITDYLNQ
jgi:hypothetical protein